MTAHSPTTGKSFIADATPLLIGKTVARVLVVTCPRCGQVNRHEWSDNDQPGTPQLRAADCGCWPWSYFVAPDDHATEGR